MPQFCPDFDVISKKRSSVFHILISQRHFDGPSAGPPEANGPHDGPPKVHEPRGYCPSAPSRRPWLEAKAKDTKIQG